MGKIRKYFWVIAAFFLVLCSQNKNIQASAATKETIPSPENVRIIRASDTSLKIKWKEVQGADGYRIYRYDKKGKKYIKIGTIKEQKTTYWMDRGLKTNKIYKYKVASYHLENEKRIFSPKSYWVKAKTYQREQKEINAGRVNIEKKITLGILMTRKMAPYVRASKYGKHKNKKALSQQVRWSSSNESVATVDKDGMVTAGTQTGTCTLYAMAHNGKKSKVKVTVVNYARPESFPYYEGEDNIFNLMLGSYKNEICNIASYFTINRPVQNKKIAIVLSDEGEVEITPSDVNIEEIRTDIEKLLVEFPLHVIIYIDGNRVRFHASNEPEDLYFRWNFDWNLDYYYNNNCKEASSRIASHWTAFHFVGE